jgi:hypothetical protein
MNYFSCANQDLLIQHTLDVMHHEKNLIEHVMNIMFGEGDTILVQKDMKDMNIRSGLWPIAKRKKGELILLVAPYVL